MRTRSTFTYRNIRNVFNLTLTLTVTLTSLIIRKTERSIDHDIDLINYSQQQTFSKTWKITLHQTSTIKGNPDRMKTKDTAF